MDTTLRDRFRAIVLDSDAISDGRKLGDIVVATFTAGITVAITELLETRIDRLSKWNKVAVIMSIALLAGLLCTLAFNVIDNTIRYITKRRRRSVKNNDDNV